MYFPTVIDNGNTRGMTNAFLGLNHNEIVGAGEFYDMKNLTADYYPLFAPRKKRNLLLEIANTEWDTVSLTVTSQADVSVSHAYGIYTATGITMDGVQRDKLSYKTDTSFISAYTTEITFKDADGNVLNTLTETAEGEDYELEFDSSEDTATIDIKVTAVGDVDTFDADDIDLYVYSFSLKQNNANIRGILLKNGKLAYMIGNALFYNGTKYDMTSYIPNPSEHLSRQQLISYGAYILVFPLGIYLNTNDPTDKGYLGATWSGTSVSMEYKLCTADGTAITATVSQTAPASPAAGDYWLCTTDNPGLYMYSDTTSSWEAVLTTYISIKATGADFSAFNKGDAVFMNTKLEGVNEGSVIQAIGTNYIVVTGLMNVASDSETINFKMERKIPKLDYVCVSNNRVWGCYAGTIADSTKVNEIYASALGDAKNWNTFEGTAADSYRLSLGDDGDFTGAITYQGYPMFFKENVVYKMYGAYPAAYQLYTYNCRGVQKGSERSLAVVNEYLMYKSVADVCVFDGNSPVGISDALGKELFFEAAGGAALNKYYISMKDTKGESHLYVYDIKKALWMKEDNLSINEFSYNVSGELYGQTGLRLYGFGEAHDDVGLTEGTTEDFVSWEAETGDMGYDLANHKYVKRIAIRARIPYKAEVKVSISYDDEAFEALTTVRGQNKVKTDSISANVRRCDHYRLKLSGHGDVRIYSIATDFSEGSTK